MVVSGYDETILYANNGLRRVSERMGVEIPRLPVDYIGRPFREVAELHGVPFEDTAVGRVISTGEFASYEQAGGWGCGSPLPLADVSTTIIASHHLTADRERARREHLVLALKAIIALETYEAERLVQVGMEALHRSRQRVQHMHRSLLEAIDVVVSLSP